ncbi:MAG TPA: AAA family ATPase, partial [Polyangiales bacterium]|nr:AAA family ATPase [Polyangiales bacterium]
LDRRIDGRYLVQQLLGRGGMAAVYQVLDERTDQTLALKQLTAAATSGPYAGMGALFEREFHTLLSLSHPRVIAVYDYGVDAEGPYYTMELLDGGDLREQSPLPWREACSMAFEICSSLALLHSRRLLHHDISPRNIRRTRDGRAKLIDFGAMAPMGVHGGQLVGTPPFVSPEALHRSALDARADLFSLGAALYYALTGKLAYPARSFAEVQQAWTERPAPPSLRARDVPPALDELVLSLISIEPGLRPQSAYEVMQRVAAIAGLALDEAAAVSQAYLATPLLAGREDAVAALRAYLARVRDGHGTALLLRGPPGIGRSRILDACAVEAKTLGATVLRAAASGTRRNFVVALDLARHLLEAVPEAEIAAALPELAQDARGVLEALAERGESQRLQELITQLLLRVSQTRLVVIAVDDLQRIDEPSAAVLVALADRARRNRLLLALTAPDEAQGGSYALQVLASRTKSLALAALSREQTQALLSSVFGDVANLELLAREIFGVAHGNPRQTLDVAQHLVDHGLVRYAAGAWTLPSSLSAQDLPHSADAAIGARIDALSPEARLCVEAQALAYHDVFRLEDYRALLPGCDVAAVDAAVSELVARQAVESDGQEYRLASRMWADAVRQRLSPERRRERHGALAQLHAGKHRHARMHHLIEAGEDEAGLDELLALHASYNQGFDYKGVLELANAGLVPSYMRAIEAAQRLSRPQRELAELRRWATALSATTSAELFWSAGTPWLEQLVHDSGLGEYRAAAHIEDRGARLMHALTRAQEKYAALPERERVYSVEEAIPRLAEYTTFSIAVGSRTLHNELLGSLPELLEPFAVLSPLLDALHHNAIATVECARDARYEQARDRWLAVFHRLEAVSGAELQHLEAIRNALAYGVGVLEASFGIAAASSWADLIEGDPMQQLGALNLRKIVRLEQGDWHGADRLRREAEVAALRSRTPPMFHYTLTVEISAYAGARDLMGVKQVIARFEDLAEHSPGWSAYLRDAQARFHLLRGDFAAAKTGFEQTLELTALDAERRSRMLPVWVTARAGLAEALFGLGAYAESRDGARAALAICSELQIVSHASELTRVLALAEAKLGDYASSVARLDALIARQLELGTTGLRLGLSYEARAQIAIWADDERAFEEFSRLTAREYRYGVRCPLSARYERLMNEARARGMKPPAQLGDFAVTQASEGSSPVASLPMSGELHTSRALRSICEQRRARAGHLYAVEAGGLRWSASCGAARPSAVLEDQVLRYAEQELERIESSSDPDEETQLGTVALPSSVARAEGTDYELVVLSGVVDHTLRVAGVIAFEGAGAVPREQAAMIASLAAHVLGAGKP